MNPNQSLNDYSLLYPANYYKQTKGVSVIFEKLFLRERKALVEAFKKKGKLLDIGCGEGKFLEAMGKNGWLVFGIEPSASFEDAPMKKEINLQQNRLTANHFENESFDVITLWQVLEHLDTPKEYLGIIRNILRKDGVLVISVPNLESLQFRFSRHKWFHLDLPRHKWYFTVPALSKLLRECHFQVKKIRHFSLEYNFFGWWQSLFNLLGCEMNFAYKYLKRGRINNRETLGLRRLYTTLGTAMLALPFLVMAFIFSSIESMMRRGGIITVIAVKE